MRGFRFQISIIGGRLGFKGRFDSIRGQIRNFSKYHIGKEDSVFFWVDNWHEHSPLISYYGERIVYDAASNAKVKAKIFIRYGNWCFPRPLSNDLIDITMTSIMPQK